MFVIELVYTADLAEIDAHMAAHVKSVLTGPSLTLPVTGGRLALGTWQGVYLCEHRDRGGPRSVTVTLWGEGKRGG